MAKQPTQLEIYWDKQDRANEGWAERVTYSDGSQVSGPSGLAAQGTQTELEDAVVDLARQHGLTIDGGSVAVEPNVDGGYACWIDPEN